MMTRRLASLSLAVMLLMMVLAGCGATSEPLAEEASEAVSATQTRVEAPVPPMATPSEPVTMQGYLTSEIPTLDPQLAYDLMSINYIENLFVNLTNRDPETLELVPEAAQRWQASDDGLVYTFRLRTDIPWVRHDPESGETLQAVDEQGNARTVTAHDFAYGIRRACDPTLGSYYSAVVAPLIKGCQDVLFAEDPTDIPQELVDAIGVRAPADDTLIVELEYPASYFLAMTPMWTLAATPQWAIEQHGAAWIEPGCIVSNGRYVLHEWQRGVRSSLWRNPLMPQDLRGGGNIERTVLNLVPDVSTGYALWLKNEVEVSWIPDLELEAHLEQFADSVEQVPDLMVIYNGFALDKPPFDSVQVRQAFSAAFDREILSDQVMQGQCLPMIHFAPPGVYGAPPIDEVGVGFDPDFAREQLAEAGYAGCVGFPQVTLATFPGAAFQHAAEYAQAQWAENLGCSPELIQIEQLPLMEMRAAISGPAETRPHMWLGSWAPDYPDENNWVGDVLWCQSAMPVSRGRECSALDDLIVEARQEPDQERRIALYRQIEEGFFGTEGEMPLMPVCTRVAYVANHTWLDKGSQDLFGGEKWYNWTIDWGAQTAARGD